jgi:hypothetical protein
VVGVDTPKTEKTVFPLVWLLFAPNTNIWGLERSAKADLSTGAICETLERPVDKPRREIHLKFGAQQTREKVIFRCYKMLLLALRPLLGRDWGSEYTQNNLGASTSPRMP